MSANRVVLPAPFRPSSTQNRDGAIARLASTSALRDAKAVADMLYVEGKRLRLICCHGGEGRSNA